MSQQPITPQQALETIDKVLATVNTNREGHQTLAACLQVLAAQVGAVNDLVNDLADQLQQTAQERDEWKQKAETLKAHAQNFDIDMGAQGSGDADSVKPS